MAFDADSSLPVIQPQKKTTQVNIWMAVFVALFFAATALVVVWSVKRHPRDAVHPQPSDAQRP